ncbi:3D domain protein [Bacillus phage Nachito]|nr:3D domain protein [Bacillus phage Nachito]
MNKATLIFVTVGWALVGFLAVQLYFHIDKLSEVKKQLETKTTELKTKKLELKIEQDKSYEMGEINKKIAEEKGQMTQNINDLTNERNKLQEENKKLQEENRQLLSEKQKQQAEQPQKESPRRMSEGKQTLTVKATAYTPFPEENGGTYNGQVLTATGFNLSQNPNARIIAVDPSVIPLGSKVYVEGYGEALAIDTGGAIKGNRIDVLVPTDSQADSWGVRTVQVTIL